MSRGLVIRWQESGVALVATRELAGLRRLSRWTRWLLPFYLVLLGLLAALCSILMLNLGLSSASDTQFLLLNTAVGAICPLNALAALLGLALPWIAPAVTALGIAHEREVKSWDLLRVTTIGERDLVLGKLIGGLGRLWPALLLLALLTPFRVLAGMLSGSTESGGFLLGLWVPMISAEMFGWPWLLAAMLGALASAFAPWIQLALHAAAGLFASTVARSSGVAIALAYAGVIALRIAISIVGWVVVWGGILLAFVAFLALFDLADQAVELVGWMTGALFILVRPLARIAVELALAGALVWGAIRCTEWD